jgi:hypothetical protein
MAEPNEVDSKSKHSPSFWDFILWPATVLMLYVLSIGPAVWLAGSGSPSTTERLLEAFYTPLHWMCIEVPPFGKAIDVYMHWWRPAEPRQPEEAP